LLQSGTQVVDRAQWGERRAELKMLFEEIEYGQMPPKPDRVALELDEQAIYGEPEVVRQEFTIRMRQGGRTATAQMRLTLPLGAPGKIPVVIRGRFDPPPPATTSATAATTRPSRFDNYAMFTSRGYALAELRLNQFAFDRRELPRSGAVYDLFGDDIDTGALMAWAWAMSRAIDALETLDTIDAGKFVVTGHSRDGKACLVAGAFDERIALTQPSHSGAGGAPPYRFLYETAGKPSEAIENIAGAVPHWFHPKFSQFIGKVDQLPIDQHELCTLVAPRALLMTEGLEDSWTNPRGSQLSYRAAREVYRFLGVPDRISIRYRPGGHIPNDEDLLNFADHIFFDKPLPPEFGRLPYEEDKGAFEWKAPWQ
jgi:endo-1,4-beta-xylanase